MPEVSPLNIQDNQKVINNYIFDESKVLKDKIFTQGKLNEDTFYYDLIESVVPIHEKKGEENGI
jgi:hypothetical protein